MPLNMTGVITALAASRQSDGVSQEDKTRALAVTEGPSPDW